MATSWNGWGSQLGLASWLAIGGAIARVVVLSLIAASGDSALAQIAPDTTLGSESSRVTPTGSVDQIDGGATRGANLFHSFKQFSVPTGGTAYFNNAADIQNIISRVTGSSISNIDGLLRANGTANLFLLNPNGIIFGPNASLNIGGSFLGSTASSINFADGKQFSATAHPTTPLLTVSVPLGLQYGGTAGGIQVQGTVLQVQNGQTLALMGGDVSVEGGEFGSLQALGGRVELGGLASAGFDGVNSNGAVSGAFTQVDGPGVVGNGGDINVTAGSLSLTNGAELGASTFGQGDAGSVTITARDTVSFDGVGSTGFASGAGSNVESGAVGNGGDINITTGSISLTNGAQLQVTTFGQGDAGSITITARDTVSFDGVGSNEFSSGVYSDVFVGAVGSGGDINITTGSLMVKAGDMMLSKT